MRADLVTIGESFDDLIFYDLPRLPRPGEEMKTGRFARTPGGGAVTTAVTAARLGVSTGIISALSDATRAHLRKAGVRIRDLRQPGESPAVTAALSTARDRTFVTFNGVNDVLDGRLRRECPRIRAAHVHCAFFPRRCAVWRTAVRTMQQRGSTVSWDFGWNPRLNEDAAFERLLTALDHVFVNEAEARLYSTCATLPAALAWWRRRVRTTVVKLGPRGAVHVSASRVLRAKTRTVRHAEATGAGDAFNGGYLSQLLAGADPAACLEAGNASGRRATMRAGGS